MFGHLSEIVGAAYVFAVSCKPGVHEPTNNYTLSRPKSNQPGTDRGIARELEMGSGSGRMIAPQGEHRTLKES